MKNLIGKFGMFCAIGAVCLSTFTSCNRGYGCPGQILQNYEKIEQPNYMEAVVLHKEVK